MQVVRVGVTTQTAPDLEGVPWAGLSWEGHHWSSLPYAAEILDQAQANGYRLNLFFFYSDQAAHAGQQFSPPEWAGLSPEVLSDTLYAYTKRTIRYLRGRGIEIDYYDLGNEITFGMLEFRPGERIPVPQDRDFWDLDFWREDVWSTTVTMLHGAARAVREEAPDAKIVIHGVYGEGHPEWEPAFLEYLVESGLDFDVYGTSWYPVDLFTPGAPPKNDDTLADLVDLGASLGKRVVITEVAYPSADVGFGQPVPGYPLTEEGQRAYVRDFLDRFTGHPNVEGILYFYPEYHPLAGTDDAGAYGLFRTENESKPALEAFRPRVPAAGALTVRGIRGLPTLRAGDQVEVTYRAGAGEAVNDSRFPVVVATADSLLAYVLLHRVEGQSGTFRDTLALALSTSDLRDAVSVAA